MLRARIKRLRPHIALPAYQTSESAGFDLAASEDLTVQPGEVKLVPTGLVVEVPHGYFLGVFARSSTPLKRGLMVANGVGVVDPDYSGPADEVKIEVVNFTRRAVEIKRGDRIAQGIFIPCRQIDWNEVEAIRANSRGGFGATG
jgi:dUTP pyrophosphatase